MNRYFSLRDEVLHLLDEKSHGYYKREAIAHNVSGRNIMFITCKRKKSR